MAETALSHVVPPRVLTRVRSALAQLARWNDVILQARATEEVAQAPGRYECDIRYTLAGTMHRRSLEQALTTLTTFEHLASHNGVDVQAVYASLGGRPALLPEGRHVHEWR